MPGSRSGEGGRQASGRTSGRGLPVLRVRMLGGFSVSVGDREVGEEGWRLRKAASLVKLLALAPGRRMHRERAMDLLWPDLNRGAASNNLRYALHAVRRILHPSPEVASRLLRRLGEEISLGPDGGVWTDAGAFEEAAASARRAREPAAYRAALDLYAGELLPADRYEEWAEGRRAALEELRLSLLTELAALHEGRGELGAAVEALGAIVSTEPAREEAHAGLMRLHVLSGRRAAALDQYEQLCEILRRIGVEPGPETRRLREEILAGRPEGARPSPAGVAPGGAARNHNLPAPRTSFVGRERELVEVRRLLAMTGLLTLTGPGGSGKTRLALETARGLAPSYPDGAWLAELAPLSDPALVPRAVAGAVGVGEEPGRSVVESLVEGLREKELLLVLDNCEHVVGAAADLVDALLSSCPGVRILATSREALNVPGELGWSVPPLALPDPGRTTVEDLEGYGAARLFVERALHRPSAFVLTGENAGDVAEICRKLEGIPLAIELAAARVGALAVEQISQRLDDSLGLLTTGARTATPRQRTLRGALDWSFDLLDEQEKAFFARLSVFAGGWTLEAAGAVATGDGVEEHLALDLLSRLVDKSLVVVGKGDGEARYRFLEPVRQYAWEKLESEGGAGEAVRRHAGWYLRLAERANVGLRGSEEAAWVGRVEAEHPDLLAALFWSLEADPRIAVRIASALGHFWYAYGHVEDGLRWLEATLEKTSGLRTATRATVLHVAGILSEERGLYARAEELYEESLALRRLLGDKKRVAASLLGLGNLAHARGDTGRAVALTEQALSAYQEVGYEKGVEMGLNNLGELMRARGELVRARAFLEQSLEMARKAGNERDVAISMLNLGALAVEQNDPGRAETMLIEALEISWRIGDLDSAVECLESLAWAVGSRGAGSRAATLLGAAASARTKLGTPVHPVERPKHERLSAMTRLGSDENTWNAAWSAGRAMPLEEAVEHALSPGAEAPASFSREDPSPQPETPRPILTRREGEVADLVAQGLTNRQIASRLVLSERTVDNHVASVLKKLRVSSRRQVGARLTG